MASERFDRGIVQVQPVQVKAGTTSVTPADLTLLTRRLNEKLRYISEMIYRLEGRSGETTTSNSSTINIQGNTFLEFSVNGKVVGGVSLDAFDGRNLNISFGAIRGKDGQWIATDTGAWILSFLSTGAGGQTYKNSNLTVGAAFTPTAGALL
jgi:hypothetical protein